jgi:hypothetical protein
MRWVLICARLALLFLDQAFICSEEEAVLFHNYATIKITTNSPPHTSSTIPAIATIFGIVLRAVPLS